jgi:NAD(P)H-hydrate epimerase
VQFVHQFLRIASSRPGPRIGFQNLDQRSLSERQVGFHRDEAPSLTGVRLPPLVVDADGLNALSEADRWWMALPPGSILTPHPGEMGRLMGASAGDVNRDRLAVALTQAAKWHQIVVLKGAYTVVAAPDGRATVLPFANPALATAGTGDVLAGSIVGLLAQGLAPFDAALCGAYLHGLAGQIVRERIGDAGLFASDLLPALPQAIRRLKP